MGERVRDVANRTVNVRRCDAIHARGIVSHLLSRHDSVVDTGDIVESSEYCAAPEDAFCLEKETMNGSRQLVRRATMENITIAKDPYRMDAS